MDRIIETLKTVLLIILAVSMLGLWTAYIYIQFDRADRDVAVLENDFWIYTDTENAHIETAADGRFFSPYSVSLMLSGKGYTSAFNTELTAALYELYTPLLSEIFSSSYRCEKATALEWQSALSLDGVMIEYAGQLPYTAIAEFLPANDSYCTGEVCLIERLILFSDSANMLCALSSDSVGNVYSFKWNDSDAPSAVYDFNSNNLAAYTVNEGFTAFDFNLRDGSRTNSRLPDDYKLLATAPCLPDLTVTAPLWTTVREAFGEAEKPYLELIEDGTLQGILHAFEINPNVAGFYSDKNSGLYFVGENMRLTVTPEGAVSYSVAENTESPISNSSLLDTARTEFTSNELMTAATVFLSRLPQSILGGDAQLLLTSVRYSADREEFTFDFEYFYRLARVSFFGNVGAISLTFNSNGLTSASLLPMSASVAENSSEIHTDRLTTDILPEIAARIITDTSSVPEPVYSVEELNSTVTPLWAIKEVTK